MTAFSLVTMSRDDPKSEISVVVEVEEWEKLRALAEALPDYMTWTARPHDGQSHSHSVVESGGV